MNVCHKELGKIPAPWERILNRRNKTKYNTVITSKLHILPKMNTNLQNTADTHDNNGMQWTLSAEFIQFIWQFTYAISFILRVQHEMNSLGQIRFSWKKTNFLLHSTQHRVTNKTPTQCRPVLWLYLCNYVVTSLCKYIQY